MPRKLDLSMLDGGDTPGPRRTPLAHKVLDRFAPKREPCKEHCRCVTTMRLKVSVLWWLFVGCAGVAARNLVAEVSRPRVQVSVPVKPGQRMGSDRVEQPDAGRP